MLDARARDARASTGAQAQAHRSDVVVVVAGGRAVAVAVAARRLVSGNGKRKK